MNNTIDILCAIMQPTYLPWSGYFNLIATVDKFVLLDDVQFERRSWQSRNRILNHGNELLLTVPVCKHSRDTLIRDIMISGETDWREKHLTSIRYAYKSAPFYAEVYPLLEKEILQMGYVRLSELNIGIIRSIASALGINTEFHLSSKLACQGKRSEHLLNICSMLGANKYLSPQGSRQYIEEEGYFLASGVSVNYQNFAPRTYHQSKVSEFVSHLSIVDVAMSIGWDNAREYIGASD